MDPAGRHLGRGGPTDSPQKEQCRETVRTVLTHWARGTKTRSPYDLSLVDHLDVAKTQ